jgi:aryl-alcohol dehydrogenase-like predicted oxidoreductase
VSETIGRSPAEVALNWVATQPGVTSTILGASKLSQLEANLASLDFTIPDALRARLDKATAIEVINPYRFFEPQLQAMINGGTQVSAWRA